MEILDDLPSRVQRLIVHVRADVAVSGRSQLRKALLLQRHAS